MLPLLAHIATCLVKHVQKQCPDRHYRAGVHHSAANPLYGLPRKDKKLIDRSGEQEGLAVVYPATCMGSIVARAIMESA